MTTSDGDAPATTGRFRPEATTVVVDEARTHVLAPGDDEVGWLAQRGRVPLGYLNDPEKTAATFPVVDGERMSVAGDRARWLADGTVELLGREAACINTGGEKVFAEEVEHALAHHPGVADCLVVGRPHERFGNEVVAVVAPRPGATLDLDALRARRRRPPGRLQAAPGPGAGHPRRPEPERQARLHLGPRRRHRRGPPRPARLIPFDRRRVRRSGARARSGGPGRRPGRSARR